MKKAVAYVLQRHVFMDELVNPETGDTDYQCNDTSYCLATLNKNMIASEVEAEYAR